MTLIIFYKNGNGWLLSPESFTGSEETRKKRMREIIESVPDQEDEE